jgi:hypothetical protein
MRNTAKSTDQAQANARLIATVASESRPYTDPGATYPRARAYQQTRAQGAARNGGGR